MGLSGLPLASLIKSDKILFYLLGVLIAYVAAFVITYLLAFNDPVEEDREYKNPVGANSAAL